MKFVTAIGLTISSAYANQSYQTVGYCGVPAVKPNDDLFDNLPLRSYHTQNQNHRERIYNEQVKQREETSSAQETQYGAGGRLRTGGRMGPRPPYGAYGVNPQAEPYDEEQAPSMSYFEESVQTVNTVKNSSSKYEWPLRNKNIPAGWYDQPEIATRIIGGEAAVPGSWPWQVHLSVCGKWDKVTRECNICGGSLISDKWIVTAAHCIPEEPEGTVMVGAYSVSEGGTERIRVKRFVAHPSWNYPSMFDNDIAVLELEFGAQFNEKVSPICLPQKSVCFTEGTPCVVTGWGLINERGGFPDKLQEVAVKLISRERCRQYSGYNHITDRMTCAGYESGGYDACAGDSGGPLVCRDGVNGPWVLYGIVSWGYGCARPGNPGVYAMVPALVDWVKQETDLAPEIKMDECYDGVKDLPKPPPTIPPKRTAAPVIAREVTVPETYHCSDTDKGMGQFQKDSGIFQSYNFPKQYPAEEFCYYCVSPAEEGGYVKVEIDELALDRKKNCHKNGDYMVVEQENKQAYYLCNVKKRDGHTIVNRGNICLKFVTNKSKNKKGFKAKYSQVASPPSGCGGDQIIKLNEDTKNGEFVLKSGKWPQKYNDKVAHQCAWLVSMTSEMKSSGTRMEYDFAQLQLEKKSVHCSDSDRITIYGATSCEPAVLKKAPILYEFCGYYKHSSTPLIKVNAQSTCIVFEVNGDSSKNGVGFHMGINLTS